MTSCLDKYGKGFIFSTVKRMPRSGLLLSHTKTWCDLILVAVSKRDLVASGNGLQGRNQISVQQTSTKQASYLSTCHNSDVQVQAMKYKCFEEIPGPKGLPIIGVLHKYLPYGEYDPRDIYTAFKRKFLKYGPVVKENLNGVTMIHLFDPKDFETLLRNEGKYPFRGYVNGIKKYREERNRCPGLMNMEGAEWYRLRSEVAKEMLKPEVVSSYLKAQDPVVDDLITYINDHKDENDEVDNFLNVLYRWAMESMGVVCFNTRLHTLDPCGNMPNDETQSFIDAIGTFMEALNKTVYLWPLHKSGKTKTWRNLTTSMDLIWKTTNKYFNECLSGVSETRENFLSRLVNKSNMSSDEAQTMTNDLFFAAVDTTAHSLGFLLYHLARNPDKQEKLFQEISHILESQEVISRDVLGNMPYLKAVIKESVRLCPVIGSIVRVLDKDMVIGGYEIPKGSKVLAHSNFTSRSEANFPQADSFIPERWLRTNSNELRGHNPFAYLPFGHGGRGCVGRRFAEQEMYLATTKLIQNYKVEYHHEDIGMATRTVMKPNKPLRFSFIKRSN